MQERAGTEREQEREEAPLVRVLRSIADRIGGKDGMMVRTAAKILDDLGSEAVEGDGVEEVAITDEPMDQETAEMIRSFGATPQDADAPEADDEWPWMRWLEEINAYASNLTELGPVEDERAAQKMADEVHNLTAGLRGFIARRLRRGGGEGEKDWESVREKWDARYMTDPEFHAWVDSVVSRACELERDRLLRSMGRQIEEGGFGGAMQKALSRLWDLAQDCQASGDDDIAVCIYMEVNKMRRLLRDRLRDAPSEGAPTVSDVEDVMHRDFPDNIAPEERRGGWRDCGNPECGYLMPTGGVCDKCGWADGSQERPGGGGERDPYIVTGDDGHHGYSLSHIEDVAKNGPQRTWAVETLADEIRRLRRSTPEVEGEAERLRAALLDETCDCYQPGHRPPDPEKHSRWCGYRVALQGETTDHPAPDEEADGE